MTLPIYRAVPSQAELTDLELQVSRILGWQAGTREVRQVIVDFRSARPPVHRYSAKVIAELRQVISPPQGITVTQTAKAHNRFPRIGA